MPDVNLITSLKNDQGHLTVHSEQVGHLFRDLSEREPAPRPEELPEDQFRKVEAFLLSVVQNIDWYKKKLRGERAKARWYVAISLLVLILLPAALYCVPLLNQKAGAEVVVAQVSAVLTGFLALYKMLSTLMSQNMRIGRFWKASADLSEIYYSFRTKWLGRKFCANGSIDSSMLDDMDQAVAKARQIVREEQNDFFNSITLPAVDIASILGTAQTQAATLIAQAKSPGLSRMVNAEKVRALQRECTLLEQEIGRKNADLGKAESESEKSGITTALNALNQRLSTKQTELIAAMAAEP